MLNFRRLILAIVPALLIWTAAIGQTTGVTDPKDLRVTLKISNQPLGIVFRTLINEYGVRIGFEKSSLDNDHNDYDFDRDRGWPLRFSTTRSLSVNIENAPLENAMNIICEQLKNYEWKFNDGVVNFIPKNGREKHLEGLMDLKIREFKVIKGTKIGRVTDNLLRLPEIVAYKKDNKFILSNDGHGFPDAADSGVDFDGTYTNLSFRELLNRITAEKEGGWMVQRCTTDWGDDQECFTVSL